MQRDVNAERAHARSGAGDLPLGLEARQFELAGQQRADRNSRPRTRRWRALTRLDEEVDRITQSHSEAMARLAEAEQAFADAPRTDAQTLASWIAGGERGERPAATLPERERERAAAELLVNAISLELDQKLEQRLRHVEKNREKMISDARRDIDAAHGQLLGRVNQLPALRQQLADSRELLLWAAGYPDAVTQFGLADHVALGLMAPVERTLSTRARIAYTNLLAVLEEDANALANTFSDEQKKQLGTPVKRTPVREAMWADDPDHINWEREQFENARRLANFHP